MNKNKLISNGRVAQNRKARYNYEINEKLEDQPELINSDPYNEGWIVKIELTNSSEIGSLLDLDAYNKLIS